MNEFKLEYYFALYKDKPLPSRNEFRMSFRKKNGKFIYIEELILMIEQYQVKKYGETIGRNYIPCKTSKERHQENVRAYLRNKKRLGR